jgi:plasmid stabilization system protein ParE
MTLPLIVREQAECDMVEARDWYEGHREGLGGEFLTAVVDVFDRIRDSPESYAMEYRGVRPARLRRFPYIVYYRIVRDSIEVLAVLHGRRHPRAWRSRTENR